MSYPCRSGIAKAVLLLGATGLSLSCQNRIEDSSLRGIDLSVLEDKIRGGWAGQMIGVSFGASTEFQYLGELVPEEALVDWTPDMVAGALNQDDLYVDITLASVLDQHGLDATTDDFGALFREAGYSLWHANLAARRALRRGVPATDTGTPEHNVHANDIDFQIEADFIGLMTPGLPQASNELCERAGRVMNSGDGLYGGMFVSAMYSAAFFEDDPRQIVESGLAVLPAESPYAQVIADVLAWSTEYPDNWIRVWELVNKTWARREPCSEGALSPFNIDAKINGAYVALGLLYGEGDFAATMRIATRAGQDSDCNPASAAMVENNGGRLEGDTLSVEVQAAEPAPLEIWDDYGSPVERIATDDRWTWQGDWHERTTEKWGQTFTSWASAASGAEGSIRFEGTGVILVGWFLPTGGLADIYLDGELVRTVDTYPDEDDYKFNESIWHAFGLQDGEHQIRVVVRGEPYRDSQGSEVCLTDLVVFR
jgi:hypothetical protein